MPEIDVEAATAALEASGGMPDRIGTQGTEYNRDGSTGRFASKQPEPETPESVETEAEVVSEDTPSFTHITDEAILNGEIGPQELLAYKRAMNADYTRKTQEAAPWRKLGEATGVQSPEELQAAAELYAQLQNPANLPQFHAELAAHMERYGMTPAQASQAAAEQLAAVSPAEDYTGYEEDEGTGVSPQVIAMLKQQQDQIAKLTQAFTQQQQETALTAQQHAIAEHLTRQEAQIVETSQAGGSSGYTPEEIEAIYSMMGTDGNLVAAAQRFDSLVGAGVQRYLGQKMSASETTPHAATGNQVLSTEPEKHMTWDEAHKAAMAHVELLERDGSTS